MTPLAWIALYFVGAFVLHFSLPHLWPERFGADGDIYLALAWPATVVFGLAFWAIDKYRFNSFYETLPAVLRQDMRRIARESTGVGTDTRAAVVRHEN